MTPRVILATRLYPPEVGAAAFRLEALAQGLCDAGASVRVLTTRPPAEDSAEHDVAAGARAADDDGASAVRRWPVLRDAGGNVRGYVQYLSFDVPLFFRLLVTPGDLVVAEPPPTTGVVVALSCWIRRRGFVYYAADIWTDAVAAMGGPRIVTGLMRVVEGWVLRRARAVIAISAGVAEQTRQFGIPAGKVTVVGNGVNTAVFRPEGPAADPGYRYLVYTGTMSEWQGAEVFIQALPEVLSRFPDVRLHFFGQGSAEVALRRMASELAPERVVFGGVVPPEEAARWIRGAVASLVSIVPDQGYDFAKPTKIYAAAACGTPVVYAGKGACVPMVEDNRLGTACEFSPKAVANALLRYLGEPDPHRAQRARWVEENASLGTTGRAAAAEVLTAIRAAR